MTNEILYIGQKISVAGYLYEVIRGSGPFFTLKWKGPWEKEKEVFPTRLKKKDQFTVNDDIQIKVVAVSGTLFRIKVKREQIRILESNMDSDKE